MVPVSAQVPGTRCSKSGPTKPGLRKQRIICLDIRTTVRAAASITSAFTRLYCPPTSKTTHAHHTCDCWRTQDEVTNRTFSHTYPLPTKFPSRMRRLKWAVFRNGVGGSLADAIPFYFLYFLVFFSASRLQNSLHYSFPFLTQLGLLVMGGCITEWDFLCLQKPSLHVGSAQQLCSNLVPIKQMSGLEGGAIFQKGSWEFTVIPSQKKNQTSR